MDPLKLVALDNDDLEVISAHLQDAVVNVGDIVWLPAEKRVVIALNRFDWVGAQEATPHFRRRRAALRFERVDVVKAAVSIRRTRLSCSIFWPSSSCRGRPARRACDR